MQHATFAERQELKALSQRLFGASSKWQKMQRDTPVFNGNDPKTGRPMYRQPTYEEILKGLRYMADVADYQEGSPVAVAEKAANEFVEKRLSVAVVLEVSEEEKAEFDNTLSLVPTEYHEWVKKMASMNVTIPQQSAMVRVKGLLFLSALRARLDK